MRKVIGIFRHETLEKLLQIASGGGIGVFHNDDAATGVLNKNGDRSVSDTALVDLRLNVISDFIECLAVGAHFELVMADVHFQECYLARWEGQNKERQLGQPSIVGGLETASP